MSWILQLGGGCLLLSILAGLSSPKVVRSSTSANRFEAIDHLKHIHLALVDFEGEYGTFPDASTIPKVRAATGTKLVLGNSSSNELFRQLIETGTKERSYWAKTSITPRLPDEIVGSRALEKGECAFTYIASLSSSSSPAAPLAMAPVISSTWEFDPKPFEGKAVALRVDGSVTAEPIDKHGNVMIGGMNLFDPRQPYWRGKAPDIKWPE